MLSRLGFSDPDKKNPLHDLACQYIATPEVAEKLCLIFGLELDTKHRSIKVEIPLSKWQDRYKTTIGFMDVAIPVRAYEIGVEDGARYEPMHVADVEEAKADGCEVIDGPGDLVIEVKTSFTNLGDILRQIKLYREYLEARAMVLWILATTFEMTEADVESLKAEDIFHVFLGEGFQKWAKAREKSPKAASLSL